MYHLSAEQGAQLNKAAMQSAKMVTLNLANAQNKRRETAVMFAREFDSLNDETLTKIRELMAKSSKGAE
jgi:hypothetical protein